MSAGSGPGRRLHRRDRFGRRGRAVLSAVVVALLALLAVDVRLVAFPDRAGLPGHADVLFVLGPHDAGRIADALRLMDAGLADELVVSTPTHGSLLDPAPSTAFCTAEHPYPVTCFVPEPSTTRGEAAQLARWRAERGWGTVLVLTARPHVSRTRYIMGQCGGGPVTVLSYDGGMNPPRWARQFAYQGVAFVKAAVMGPCR